MPGIPLLPLTVKVFDGRLYVYRDYSTDNQKLEGDEVISINGVSAKHILKVMMTTITGDGNTRTAKPYRIGHYGYFNTFLYSLMGIESPFRVVCRDEHGRKITAEMEGILCRKLTTYHLAVSGYKAADRSILPDYPVRHTIADLLAGNDKDMDLALSLARTK